MVPSLRAAPRGGRIPRGGPPSRLTPESLGAGHILVIASGPGHRGSLQALANAVTLEGRVDFRPDAFPEAECRTVREWVSEGGALLPIADHAPAGAAARSMAGAAGVAMTDWCAEDPGHHDPETDSWGWQTFERVRGRVLLTAARSPRLLRRDARP